MEGKATLGQVSDESPVQLLITSINSSVYCSFLMQVNFYKTGLMHEELLVIKLTF